MATIDWPDALVPQTCQLALRKSGQQFASPFNGTTQALDFIAERWVLSVSLAQMAARNPRGVGSFCNRLAGGVERVRGWNFGHNRGVPMGTLRGVPTLSAGVARGDVALPVAGALAGVNRLLGGGFEVDTNADGVSDGWTPYSAGSTGSVTYSRVAGILSPTAQRVDAAALGSTGGDRAGLLGSISLLPGSGSYVLALDALGSTGLTLTLSVDWIDGANAVISSSNVTQAVPTVASRVQFALTAPALTAKSQAYLWMTRTSGTASASLLMDNLQLEAGAVASAFAGQPTLRADDMLGCGGQLFQVASDVTLSDMGAGSVPVVNRVRATIASSTAVLWTRPTAEFILPAMQAGPVYRPGAIESAALDLVEVWG